MSSPILGEPPGTDRTVGRPPLIVVYASTLAVAERMPSGAGDHVGEDVPDADRLEEDWNRALDVASEAVSDSSRADLLSAWDVSRQSESVRGQRKWLSGFGPALRKLFPRRKRPE